MHKAHKKIAPIVSGDKTAIFIYVVKRQRDYYCFTNEDPEREKFLFKALKVKKTFTKYTSRKVGRNERNQGSTEKWLILQLEQQKYKSLEHLVGLESQEVLKKKKKKNPE